MSQDENSYLQKYLKKLNPTIEIRDGPDFRRPRMVRSIKSQSIELGSKEDQPPSLIRVARVRSSTNKCRQELHVRPQSFDEPSDAVYTKPKLLDPLLPQQMSLLPTSKLLPDTSGTVDRRSVLSTQWSLSSVSLADNDDNNSDDDIKVQNSLRNIRGSARQRKMARNSQLSMFKAQTPQRDKRKETSDQTVDQSSDLSVLDILSEKRKQSREKMKVMIGGQYWLLKPLSDSTSATSTETVVSSKPSVTTTTYNPDQVEQPTKISTPSPSPMDDKPKVKPRIRVRSRKTPPPSSPPQQPSYDEAPIMHKSDVEIQNLYRFNPESYENPFGNSQSSEGGKLPGNGSSTYPGFELVESKQRKEYQPAKPVKLTGFTKRNFAVQGVTTTIGQRDSPVYDSLDVSIDLKEDDNNEEPVEEPKMSRIMKRPKSLPVQRAYTSFVAATPVPETNNKPAKLGEQNEQKENARTQSINEIKSRLQTALAILPDSKTHWETTIENLHNIRDIAKNHTKLMMPRVGEYTNLVIHHCNNIRSRISGAAIDVLSDVFNSLRLNLIPNIEPAIKALMAESGKENAFIREKCEKCFQTIIEVMCDSNQIGAIQKILSSLHAHTRSKSSAMRVMTAQYIEQTILQAKPDRCLSDTRDITDKVINAMIHAVKDSATETRFYGRRIVHHLAESEQFDRRCKQYLSAEDVKRVNMIKSEGQLESKSITKLKMTRSIYSSTSPKKSVSQRNQPQKINQGLKEELNAASKSTSLRDKIKSLELMKKCIRDRGTLGNELANGCDILCSMIKSAAVANHRAAIQATNLFIPLIKDEKILVTNLLKVLVDKINSTKVNVRPLLDQISTECHPSIILPFYAQHITQSRIGRADCCEYLLMAADKLREHKPSFVANYTKTAYWAVAGDRNCVAQAAQLEELMDYVAASSSQGKHRVNS